MVVGVDDIYKQIESLEVEKSLLSQQVKDLENALNKQKQFHRKFVADVTEAEEMRIKDFNNETKELREENKRLRTQNRELMKEKAYYQAAYNSLPEEDVRSNDISQSRSEPAPYPHDTGRSSSDFHLAPSSWSTSSISEVPVQSQKEKTKSVKVVTKLTEKWFEDYKKIKLKSAALSTTNTHLKLKVKKLENFKNKIEKQKVSQETYRNDLHSLSKTAVKTNEQIFNAQAMAKLLKLTKQ